jgi:hypothetical protein
MTTGLHTGKVTYCSRISRARRPYGSAVEAAKELQADIGNLLEAGCSMIVLNLSSQLGC